MTANPITLAKGSHEYDGTDNCPRCLFEAYNLITREQFTDERPPGVSPALHVFGMRLNDCLPDDIRQRVRGCTDTSQLEAWGYLAVTAGSLEEIFGS